MALRNVLRYMFGTSFGGVFGVFMTLIYGGRSLLTPGFVAPYNGRLLNIHPSLLPRFPGLDTHQRAIDAGERWHGSTVHFVTEELDGGPPVIQARIRVRGGETAAQLADRVLALEHRIYPEAASLLASGRLELRDGAAWLDGRRLEAPLTLEEPPAGG